MFEIRLNDEETMEDAEEDEEDEEADGQLKDEVSVDSLSFSLLSLLSLILSRLPGQEVDPLNQTLSFQQGEELKLRDWSEERRGWNQRTPQTLMDALGNMDVNSVYNTAVEAEQGETCG